MHLSVWTLTLYNIGFFWHPCSDVSGEGGRYRSKASLAWTYPYTHVIRKHNKLRSIQYFPLTRNRLCNLKKVITQINSSLEEAKFLKSEWYDVSFNPHSKTFNPLSAHDVISNHEVAITQWPGHLITLCCSSGLSQHLWILFQVFMGVKWMLSAEIVSALI